RRSIPMKMSSLPSSRENAPNAGRYVCPPPFEIASSSCPSLQTMNDKEKQRFHQMAEKDKKRYDSEMSTYRTTAKGKEGRKKKRAKDPNAPKRSLSAFFWFCNDERAKVKSGMPDSSVGDIAKELGRRWNECTQAQKSKYEALAAKDRARYEKVNRI